MARRGRPPRGRRVPLAVYVPAELLERLRIVAEKDRRSASTQALIFIERGLDQLEG